MTAADTTAAILAGIQATAGKDMTDWAALCDHLAESDDQGSDGLWFLAVVARAAMAGHRHSHRARELLRLAGECGVLRVARTVTALCGAHGRKVERTAAFFGALARRWPYTGHRNVNEVQREKYLRWARAVERADGVPASQFEVALNLTQTLCYSVGEMLDEGAYPVLSADEDGVTVLFDQERKRMTWVELREATSQADERLAAIHCSILEQARRVFRGLRIDALRYDRPGNT